MVQLAFCRWGDRPGREGELPDVTGVSEEATATWARKAGIERTVQTVMAGRAASAGHWLRAQHCANGPSHKGPTHPQNDTVRCRCYFHTHFIDGATEAQGDGATYFRSSSW